jgi:hypothetical protein
MEIMQGVGQIDEVGGWEGGRAGGWVVGWARGGRRVGPCVARRAAVQALRRRRRRRRQLWRGRQPWRRQLSWRRLPPHAPAVPAPGPEWASASAACSGASAAVSSWRAKERTSSPSAFTLAWGSRRGGRETQKRAGSGGGEQRRERGAGRVCVCSGEDQARTRGHGRGHGWWPFGASCRAGAPGGDPTCSAATASRADRLACAMPWR